MNDKYYYLRHNDGRELKTNSKVKVFILRLKGFRVMYTLDF